MTGQFIVGVQLHPKQTNKAIRLCCVRSYVVSEMKRETTIRSQECVFHDQQGMFIHVHIPKDLVGKYKDIFVEGKVGLRNFLCITNFFKYKTSMLRYMIKFKHDTLVKEYKRVNFPKTMFRFKSFEDILSKKEIDEKMLIDVIGRAVEIYSPVEKVIAGKLSRLIDFVLEDTSQRQVKCTLWDDHVDELSPYFNSAVADLLILLIQLCWAKIMDNGEVRICSSFDATQLFFNHSCKEFRELRNSYNTKLTPLRCIQSSSRLCGANMDFSQGSNDLVVTQIEEIYSKKNLREYWVAGRIVDVESVVDWYYVSCKDNYCKRKLIEKGGMMVCGGCKTSWHEGVVRYKVIVRVADDTGDAPMLIWDRECSDLVGVSASDLLAKYPEGNKGIPPELGCLRGLSMLFRILMKKDQAESYYSAFTVLSICRDENALAQHCSNLLGSSERDGFSGDGHCVSGDFFSSDEEDCVAIEEVSQGSGLKKVTGLEDFEEGFGVDGADVTLKRSLLKDFHRCGSSKKSKGIAVNEEK